MMKKENYYPPPCEVDAITKAAIEACDELDGVKVGHGLYSDVEERLTDMVYYRTAS